MIKKVKIDFYGRPLSIEIGRLAKQADGAALVRYGDTVVLVTVVAAKELKPDMDFFPLTVDYQEKTFAAGKIPGGFFKREGRPSEKEILTCRLIDRSIRPLFSEGLRCETQVIATVLSVDRENDSDIAAMLGTSVALHTSDIPFNGPLAGVRIGRIGGQWVINPTQGQLEESDADIFLSGSKDAIVMVEGGANIIPEDEILESNGSTSMATVCGGSLALMDAGVPIAAPVAGIAMGLIKDGEHVRILSDILGDEDHLGDMDFKVAGTPEGVTSLQMDIKISGVTREIMAQALHQAKEGRFGILKVMNQTLASPRVNISGHAPRIMTINVRPEKIREIIGPGGKVIRGIVAATGVKMDVEDDGTVIIASSDEAALGKAIEMVQSITAEAEIGKIYNGTVRKIVDFGAFVEILPGTDGLIHISQLAPERVRRVSDIVKEGDEVMVKVLEIDKQGKIRLSRKEALQETGGPSGNGSDESSK